MYSTMGADKACSVGLLAEIRLLGRALYRAICAQIHHGYVGARSRRVHALISYQILHLTGALRLRH
jgi:hypothetical protein